MVLGKIHEAIFLWKKKKKTDIATFGGNLI